MEKRKVNTKIFEWIPTVSVGPFKIGDPIEQYVKQYELVDEIVYEKQSNAPKKCIDFLKRTAFCPVYYTLKYGASFIIYCDNDGHIENFRLENYLYFHNQNLISRSLDETIDTLHKKWDEEETVEVIDETQNVYYFFSLGLSLWTRNERIITAFCSDSF